MLIKHVVGRKYDVFFDVPDPHPTGWEAHMRVEVDHNYRQNGRVYLDGEGSFPRGFLQTFRNKFVLGVASQTI